MHQRKLGTQGLEVSALGLGTMGMTTMLGMPGIYGAPDEDEAIATIHRALELGMTFFDTAELYGPFVNEILVGRALKDRRDQVVIATKLGFDISDDGKVHQPNGDPKRIMPTVDAMLDRLQTSVIDLLYLHRRDPQVPIEETVGAMAKAVQAGKVKYLGLSEIKPQTLRAAHATHPITALQSEYSLWERGVEEAILPTCRELGIGFVPYSPLGRGFLTGEVKRAEQYDDYRRTDPRLQGENYDKNIKIVEQIRAIADRKSITPAQLALAWLLHQGEDIVPIPGTKRRKYIEQNAQAIEVDLSEQDLAELKDLAPIGTTAGQRYSDERMATIE